MLLNIFLIVLGIVALYGGGEVLLRGVANVAKLLGVSPFVIALTVVAFGTSAPELVVSGIAAATAPDIALGNVVGSNIANLALILGFVALLAPLAIDRALVRLELPFMVGTALLLAAFCWTGSLERWQGFVLYILMAFFLRRILASGSVAMDVDDQAPPPSRGRAWASLLVGLGLLVFGAKLLVDGAEAIARGFGLPEAVIGVTVVAFGTSVPELASCLLAAAKREHGFILGSIIGSNVFNTLLIMPTVIMIRPFETPHEQWWLHLAVMLGYSLLLGALSFRSGIPRVVGALMLAGYVVYIVAAFLA
jgi:cation:H+ antiporter